MATQPVSNSIRIFDVIGTTVLTGLLIAFSMILINSKIPTPLTEFYVLGSSGQAGEYPHSVSSPAELQVNLGITNREGKTVRYRVKIVLNGQLVPQGSLITLEDGATWETPMVFRLTQIGDNQRVDFLLFRDDDPNPYRQLHLWINVR